MPRKIKLTEKRARAALALLDNDKNLKLREVADSFGVSTTSLRRSFEKLKKSKGGGDPGLTDRVARVRKSTKAHHGSPRKLTTQDAIKVQAIINSGISINATETAKLFGVSRATIQRTLRRLKDQKEGAANLESTPDSAQLGIRGIPPSVKVRQSGTRLDAVKTAVTAEEIDQATRQRFAHAPAEVIADAKRAKDTTIALQVALRDMRLNVPEAGDALYLLTEQAIAIDNIIAILESDGDKEAARKTLRDLLHDRTP